MAGCYTTYRNEEMPGPTSPNVSAKSAMAQDICEPAMEVDHRGRGLADGLQEPLVTQLKLQVRMNIRSKAVELRTSKFTTEGGGALQKGADFVKAFALGFDVEDAIALLRLDDLYIESKHPAFRHTPWEQ
jgi:hypothetical protein